MQDLELIQLIVDQCSVRFTGRLNVLDISGQFLGEVLFKNGDVFSCTFEGVKGYKGISKLFICESEAQKLKFIVEPEVVENKEQNLHFPVRMLKEKLSATYLQFLKSAKLRPSNHLKIVINSEFISKGDEVRSEEFEVLCAMADYNRVMDIYQNCRLLEYEITNALVSLRQKKAIKVIKD